MWSWAFLCHWSFWQWPRKLRMQTEIRGGTRYAANHSDCWTALWLHGGRLAWKHYVRVCERREDSHQREKITLRVLAQCYWLEYTPYDFWRYCGGRTLRDRIDTTPVGGSIQSCPSPTPLSSTLNTESFSFPVWLMFYGSAVPRVFISVWLLYFYGFLKITSLENEEHWNDRTWPSWFDAQEAPTGSNFWNSP